MPPLAEEVDLLARARAALARDPAHALELTELHRERFGENARLGAERERIAERARAVLAAQ
ncbi:MAG TPA: hypothetical protein VIL20_31040 [Sandaracinaceae bacterium]